jgi:hypothetical protein
MLHDITDIIITCILEYRTNKEKTLLHKMTYIIIICILRYRTNNKKEKKYYTKQDNYIILAF